MSKYFLVFRLENSIKFKLTAQMFLDNEDQVKEKIEKYIKDESSPRAVSYELYELIKVEDLKEVDHEN